MNDKQPEVEGVGKEAEGQKALLAWLATQMQGPVDQVDTHAAHILLGGDRAFKLKRAVRYPYLDFSTLEHRLAACQAELSLNRRTAPDLYLGIVPILRDATGAFHLGAMVTDTEQAAMPVPVTDFGPVIDWMVVMQRFPDGALLDQQAQEHGISFDTARALADAVTSLHSTATPDLTCDAVGALRRVASDNESELADLAADLVGDQIAPGLLQELASRTEEHLARLEPLMRQRQRDGLVRHGHGDLHLRNIILLDDRPVLFDALEFDPALAITDTLYDLAFLLMDMESRGLRVAANAVWNRYRDATGETTGVALLPLFLSLRATIRAKVGLAAARLAAGDKVPAIRADALRYLTLANSFLKPAAPRLIAVGGLSGSGKSRLARGLGPLVSPVPGAVILRSDAIRKSLWGKVETERLPEAAYQVEETERVYATLLAAARAILEAGHSVIADAVHARADERAAIAKLAGEVGVPFDGCWVETSLEQRVERVTQRRGNASDATAEVARRQAGYELGTMEWQTIDSSGPPEQTLTNACRSLGLAVP